MLDSLDGVPFKTVRCNPPRVDDQVISNGVKLRIAKVTMVLDDDEPYARVHLLATAAAMTTVHDALVEALTSVQDRCSELLLENRVLKKAQLDKTEPWTPRLLTAEDSQALAHLFNMIGYKTAARFDQHLRSEIGDQATDAFLQHLLDMGFHHGLVHSDVFMKARFK